MDVAGHNVLLFPLLRNIDDISVILCYGKYNGIELKEDEEWGYCDNKDEPVKC